uniref:Uncharacterized protein TCIL3000_11_14680 n=1 Tax=Trypanosoma congolense (strain IL3000) TaxID=1068625 RepID=G0V2S9_TRYCI|nr:unnamed protein product [Trypanosoma congolense IL3000]
MATALCDEYLPKRVSNQSNVPTVSTESRTPLSTASTLTQHPVASCGPRQRASSSSYSHVLASQLASTISTTVSYPIDTLRVRFMSQDGTVQRQHNGQTYRSICRAMDTICREEGVRALFRGCHVAVLGAVVAWGVYMFIYRTLCDILSVSSFSGRAGLSFVANLIAAVVTSPIWLLKTRMQIDDKRRCGKYNTFVGGLRHIIGTAGKRSLWRGASAQLLLVVPNSLNLPIYDAIKDLLIRRCKNSEGASDSVTTGGGLTVMEACFCSAVAKCFVVGISQPLVVLKVRMQDQRCNEGDVRYASFKSSLSVILKREGLYGFTRGLSTSLLYSVPRGVVYYVLYEKSLQLFSHYV